MVRILDTTLREGEQTPGVAFPVHVKIALAESLERLGVDIVEAGHPVVDKEIERGVRLLAARRGEIRVGAHARSLKGDVDMALSCGVSFLGLFYCVSRERLTEGNRTLSQAIESVTSLIREVKGRAPQVMVRYTPEDTVRTAWPDVAAVALEAARAGADVISVADTTGYMVPGTENNLYDYTLRMRESLVRGGVNPMLAVHCHNDRGLALANALDAYRAGVDIIDASVLGLGERAGIVDLAQLMVALRSGWNEGERWDLTQLPELYRRVSRFSGIPVPPLAPVVGENAFSHCAGIHTQAAIRNPLHYQSLDPITVGRCSRVVLDHMAGTSALLYALRNLGEEDVGEDRLKEILLRVKEVGRLGRTVDREELGFIVASLEAEKREEGAR
ncbi:MAG TPA: 2-isopropylmalate synthase [Candidatus Aminicenantes bacterium]|nr:2-isopropylmalate synthase [Candidatus Aminicenantes bacterium]